MPTLSGSTLLLRVICLHPPEVTGVTFGLQDKRQAVHPGVTHAEGSLRFEGEVQVKMKDNQPDFAGVFVHGTPGHRFLYLSLGHKQGEKWQWVKRLKISLAGITLLQIKAAQGRSLEAAVDGRGAATVPLIGGWVVR